MIGMNFNSPWAWKPIEKIVRIYDMCKRDCAKCPGLKLCRQYYDLAVVPLGVGKSQTRDTFNRVMVGAAHVVLFYSPESADSVIGMVLKVEDVAAGDFIREKYRVARGTRTNWIKAKVTTKGTPLTNIDSLKLALYQSANCTGCKYAETQYIGMGKPCCNRLGCPLTDGKICVSREASEDRVDANGTI